MTALHERETAAYYRALFEYFKENQFRLLVEALIANRELTRFMEAVGVKAIVEAVGVKAIVEAVGVKAIVEAVGVDQFWANLSPEQREDLRRIMQRDNPFPNNPPG